MYGLVWQSMEGINKGFVLSMFLVMENNTVHVICIQFVFYNGS